MKSVNLILVLLFMVSCAHHKNLAKKYGLQKKVQLRHVPFIPQEEHQCGPASLSMAMASAGKPVSKNILSETAFLPDKNGSLEADMRGTIRRHGLVGTMVSTLPDILKEVEAGNPVIVHQNLGFSWMPKWHYAVVVGYNLQKNKIILHSGRTKFQELSLNVFLNTWARSDNWGIVISEAGRISPTAKEEDIVEETAMLEKLGFIEEAQQSFEAIISQWPENYPSLVGLGNIHYGKEEFEASGAAYERALNLKGDSPYIWHNYAYSLLAQKRKDEAKKAAEKALLLKPALPPLYKDDLVKLITLEL